MATTETHPTDSIRGQLGQGIYSLGELRLYLAYHGGPEAGDLALYWLTNALNPVAHASHEPDYSFSDLISLLVVRELVHLGVALHEIKEAEEYMRSRFKTDRPFVSEEVATDGETVFIRSEVQEQVERANLPKSQRGGPRRGQQAQRKVIGPYLHRVKYSDGRAVTWSPSEDVVLDPAVQFGEPVIKGTRVPTAAVAAMAEAAGIGEVANRLGLKEASARRALKFESKLSALRG